LFELVDTLREFYGQSNELRLNIKIKPEDIVEKPEALERYEQARDLGLPYVAGGLLDQPYLWVQEHGAIQQFLKEWAIVEAIQNAGQVSNAS
jgi:hypothetical protein